MNLSIFLPTCNRPEMLKTALTSIAAQTALSEVEEVVVIENGRNRNSESVCRMFRDLPIKYIFRENPLPPGIESAEDALRFISCGSVAILFDDDWWFDTHLERGIKSFTLYDDVVASYGSCALTMSEDGYITNLLGQFNQWFASSGDKISDRWRFGLTELLVANLMSTTFHFSSLIVDVGVWRQSLDVIRNKNPFDTDRLTAVELGRFGSVIVDSVPSVYIRTHLGQEGVRLNNEEGKYWWNESTEILLKLASSNNIDLKQEYESRMNTKNISLHQLMQTSNFGSIQRLIELGVLQVASAGVQSESVARSQRKTLLSCLRSLFSRGQPRLSNIRALLRRKDKT